MAELFYLFVILTIEGVLIFYDHANNSLQTWVMSIRLIYSLIHVIIFFLKYLSAIKASLYIDTDAQAYMI